MNLPTLYVKDINEETAMNYKSFDAMQVATREQLLHTTVMSRLGEHAIKRYIGILDRLVPANMQGNTAQLTKRQVAAGKIATIIRNHWGRIHFDTSVFGGVLPHEALSSTQAPVSVKVSEGHDLESFGLVTWKESQTPELVIRSNPVLVLNNLVIPGARPSILVHELGHIRQCEESPQAQEGYFDTEDSRIREELEVYHGQADFDKARIEAGLIIEGSLDDHTRPRTIDFVRKSSNPPEDDPYVPIAKTIDELKRKGIEL
jgi:hypothetical protein